MSTAGPAAWIPAPEPRKSPAPMALPKPIMVSWRGFIEWPRPREGMEGRTAVDFVVIRVCLLVDGLFAGPRRTYRIYRFRMKVAKNTRERMVTSWSGIWA